MTISMRDWLRHVPVKEPDKITYENGRLIVQWNEVCPSDSMREPGQPSWTLAGGSESLRCSFAERERAAE